MGIITEDPRPRISNSILSDVDWVKTPQDRGTKVVSGGQSVALENRCLVYRGAQAGHAVVNVIPLRSIDSFSIRTVQIRAILVGALVLLSLSAAAAFWWYLVPLAQSRFLQGYASNAHIGNLRVTAVLLGAAIILLLSYLMFRRTELVVYTLSGKNLIQLPLSRRLARSAEALVAEVEAAVEGRNA